MIDLHTVSVVIRTRDTASGKIEVHLTGTTRARQQDNIPYLSAGQKDSVLDIHIERKREISAGFHESHLVLDIGIPREYQNRLTVKTVSGDVTLTGHNYAGLALTTTSGDMELKQIQSGLFRVKTTSGDIALDFIDFFNPVNIESTSGNFTGYEAFFFANFLNDLCLSCTA